jgi:hypothetical protein
MFDEREIQWFCDDDQIETAKGMEAPFGLRAYNDYWFDDFAEACETDADCNACDG